MLSIAKIGAGDAVAMASYLENEQEKAKIDGDSQGARREDYYAEGGSGQWTGKLAETLGLSGAIEKGDLLKMYQGYHPKTGEALVKNAGEAHKAGWDCTFSAPKSVSAIWAVADAATREKIEKLVLSSTEKSIGFLESHAFSSRDRHGNNEQNKILAAMYLHATSREKEPQLHVHGNVANLSLREDGTYGATEFDLRWKMAAGAAFRAEVAAGMQSLGFNIERESDSFRVAGVPKKLCEDWSTRAAQIQAALAESGHTGAAAAKIAALSTRKTKEDSPRDELFAKWSEQASAHGFTAETITALQAEQQRECKQEEVVDKFTGEIQQPVDPLSREAIFAELTKNDSTFTQHKIYQVVAVAAQGRLSISEIETYVHELTQDRDMVKLRKIPDIADAENTDKRSPKADEAKFSTREMYLLESTLAERSTRLAADKSMTVTPERAATVISEFEARKTLELREKGILSPDQNFELNDEQREGVIHMTSGTGQLALVRGAAGAGKTTMLEAAKVVWEDAGFRVRGAALAGKAAAGMVEVGIKSQTVASLLMTEEKIARAAAWLEKTETSYGEMRAKVDMIEPKKRTEKVLAWETKSTNLRDAAAESLREALDSRIRKNDVLLIDEAGMIGSHDMNELTKKCFEAGAKMGEVGDEKQLQAINAGGAFKMQQRIVGCAELVVNRRQRSAEDRAVAENTVNGEAGAAMLSLLKRERLRVTDTKEQAIAQLVDAWHDDGRRLEDKLILSATRANTRILNDEIRAGRLAGGELTNNQPVQTEAGKLDFAEGDRFIFLKNDSKLNVKNGHLGEIKRIELTDLGQKITVAAQDSGADVTFIAGDPANKKLAEAAKAQGLRVYNKFDHGYAVTNHKSQGVTVAASYILGLGDREMSYVQLTRHKDEAHVFLDAKTLEKAVAAAEDAASEQKATTGMINEMARLAQKGEIEAVPTELQNFRTVREWLDINSDVQLGYDPDGGKKDELAGVPEDLKELVTRLKEATFAMSASHQKDTTQDYEIVSNRPAAPTLAEELAAEMATETPENGADAAALGLEDGPLVKENVIEIDDAAADYFAAEIEFDM